MSRQEEEQKIMRESQERYSKWARNGGSLGFASDVEPAGVLKISTIKGRTVTEEATEGGKAKKIRDRVSQVIDQATGEVKMIPQGGELQAGVEVTIDMFAEFAGRDMQADAVDSLQQLRKKRRSAKKGKSSP